MKNLNKFLLLSLGLLISQNLLANESNNQQEHFATHKWVRGGILGSTIGFGIGHAVQGRWKSDGWIYTAGEIAGIGLMTTGQIIAMDGVLHYAKGSDGNGKPTVLTDSMEKQLITGAVLFGSGLLMFTGFRIAESITVWETPALAASSTMLDSGLNQKVSQLAPAEQNTAIVGMKLNF